jgi:hypothetical protein
MRNIVSAMSYKLRFVQRFKQEKAKEYLELEKQFAKMEEQYPEFPKGKRYLPVSGREPSNTLVWECDFDTLKEAQDALSFLMNDNRHEDLFNVQAEYILGTYTEIYKPYER